ncbi:Zonular occludens toxin [Duganella sp. FT80W]|uniref:Zonular occludens toxin n=1 Tax=Duganella guangzhouensis TaxID=2666084 RepID=A0A6I2KZG4_9BURK|nr:zonular occludens toxin domain-containing protein [Duganella guangzhouensis]MRW91033.1 Zonular occludens toxin [Duganella guangzhouensis]
MPINAYTGLMGSGKSFECVSSVIVPAIAKGRRVVTNVDGIDGEAIRAFVHERQGIELEKLGSVVHCQNDDVFKEDFLPYGQPVDTFCCPGDLVCIDEAWRFWGTDSKIHTNHRIFFREHRHYVHPDTKVSCDLVLMVQDIGDLHRILKAVVELSFRTTKAKSLGLNKVYRVEMWEGWKQTIKARVAVQIKKYDKDVFPLYSSYTGGKGNEVTVDDRQNILKNPKLWAMAVGTILCGVVSVYGVMHFFGNKGDARPTSVKTTVIPQIPNTTPAVTSPTPSSHRAFSDDWRAAGSITIPQGKFIVLVSSSGALRYEHPSVFKFAGQAVIGDVDGAKVTAFSGIPPTRTAIAGQIKTEISK